MTINLFYVFVLSVLVDAWFEIRWLHRQAEEWKQQSENWKRVSLEWRKNAERWRKVYVECSRRERERTDKLCKRDRS